MPSKYEMIEYTIFVIQNNISDISKIFADCGIYVNQKYVKMVKLFYSRKIVELKSINDMYLRIYKIEFYFSFLRKRKCPLNMR